MDSVKLVLVDDSARDALDGNHIIFHTNEAKKNVTAQSDDERILIHEIVQSANDALESTDVDDVREAAEKLD